MRRMQEGSAEAVFTVEERIVQAYAPYVLVRCARYTNGRRQAQQIGAYTLVTACLLAQRLGHTLPVGTIVEIVLSMVGPDVLAGAEGEDWRIGGDEPLIADPGMRKIAQGLNALERSLREVLVLHYVSGLDMEDLVRLLRRPAGEIVASLGRAERLLAGRLEGLRGEDRGASGVDVRSLLAQFTAGLDAGWIAEVAHCAMDYLATCGRRQHRRRRANWN